MKRYLDTYVIRIYRRGTTLCRDFLGVVEEIEVPGEKAFANLNELWDILDAWEQRPEEETTPNTGSPSVSGRLWPRCRRMNFG